MTCTFFGHSDCPSKIKPRLRAEIIALIENGANLFYVGNNGNFDFLVQQILREIKPEYNNIEYYIVLAYPPSKSKKSIVDYEKTLLPDKIEMAIPRFAISYRNKWLVENSDCVITYIKKSYGGAYQFATLAKKKGKMCINIANA